MMDNIDNLIEKLAQDGAMVKRAQHPFLLSTEWIAVALFYLAILLMAFGTRSDLWQQLHRPWFAAELAALAGILVSTSLSAALLSYPDAYQKPRLVFTPAVAVTLFIFVIYLAWRAEAQPTQLPAHTFECTRSILLVALLPAAWMFHTIRKLASTRSHWAGSFALLFAFSIGAMWERFHEQTNAVVHVIEWHYLPMIAFGLLGMWLGKKLLKW